MPSPSPSARGSPLFRPLCERLDERDLPASRGTALFYNGLIFGDLLVPVGADTEGRLAVGGSATFLAGFWGIPENGSGRTKSRGWRDCVGLNFSSGREGSSRPAAIPVSSLNREGISHSRFLMA